MADFQAMFEGRDPTTGELLGRPHSCNAASAFDVVLRPTKSVSVLYGLGDPATGRAVLAAHHAGVTEAVAYLDEHLGTRRGHGGVEHVSGQGMLAVGFDHRTSREGDPLLQTHVVVANRVRGPDGRWTALDGRDLYRHRLAADAIYRAAYQWQLSRTLGFEWTAADQHGNRELQFLHLPDATDEGPARLTGCGSEQACTRRAAGTDCVGHPKSLSPEHRPVQMRNRPSNHGRDPAQALCKPLHPSPVVPDTAPAIAE